MLNDLLDTLSLYSTNLWDPSCPVTSAFQLAVDCTGWQHTLVPAFGTHGLFCVSTLTHSGDYSWALCHCFPLPFTIHIDFMLVYALLHKQYVLMSSSSFFACITCFVSSEKKFSLMSHKKNPKSLIMFDKNNFGVLI